MRSREFVAGIIYSILLATGVTAATPVPRVTEEQVVRMVAPSPARELHRYWQRCIDGVAEIARLNAIGDASKIEDLASFTCDAEESRLTGELIKRHGYERGNAAIAALKRKNRVRFEEVVRAVTAKPKGYFSQVGDWIVRRGSAGQCSAKISDDSLVYPKSSWIMQHKGQWLLVFLKETSRAKKFLAHHGQVETVNFNAYSSGGIVAVFKQQLKLEVEQNSFVWSMPMDDAAANRLSRAERIQFQALIEEDHFVRVFPITGIRGAWNEVRKCAGI